MADSTLKVRLVSAYKTSAQWDTLNPVLKNGEVGYVSSPASMYGWYKIGNGTSTWKQLSYSTYRPLNNGDFDTINVTDETAGDLIVTGAARFLNTIQGTATSASNAAKVAGTLTITQAGTTKLNAWNGSAATSIALTDNNTTYKFATSYSGVTSAIAGLKANGASTFDSTASLSDSNIVNPMLNSLTTGDAALGTTGYLITANANATSPTTTWHRRQASLVTVGNAANSSKLGGVAASSYATKDYVTTEIAKLGQPMHYKGTVTTASGLPASPAVGDTYKVAEAGTYSSTAAKVGDMFIYGTSGWEYIPSADEDAVMSVAADETYVTTVGSQSASAVKLSHKETLASTGSYGGSASVPVISVNKAGHITAISTTNVKDTTYKFATSTSGVTTAIAGLKANGASTFDTNSSANLATSAFVNPLINALTEGSSQASTADYIITSYVAAGTPTTTYHRRKASLVTVGKAEYATSAGAAPYPVTDADRGLSLVSKKIGHANSYTATANISGNTSTTMSFGGSFAVPYFSIDAYGHATAVGQKTFTLPGNPNVDTKMTQTATTAKTYLIGNAGSATTTSGANLSTAVYMNNGNLVVGGSITIGGNNADTSGAKWQYDSTLESVSLVFA